MAVAAVAAFTGEISLFLVVIQFTQKYFTYMASTTVRVDRTAAGGGQLPSASSWETPQRVPEEEGNMGYRLELAQITALVKDLCVIPLH